MTKFQQRMLVVALLWCLAFSLLAFAPQVKQLSNGMDVILIEDHSAPLAAVRCYVKTGSVNEGELLGAGISHYFEHVIAGGSTSKHSEQEYNEWKQRIGASYNAYTSFDVTCYHLTANSEYLNDMVDIISEWMQFCAFDSMEVAREKGVIQKEILMRMSPPRAQAYWDFQQRLFEKNPYADPVIGYLNVFNQITREQIIHYYQQFYIPNNMVFVVAGDFDSNEIMNQLEQKFQTFERKPLYPNYKEPVPQRLTNTEFSGHYDIPYPTYYRVYQHQLENPRHYWALNVLSEVLTNNQYSLLTSQLRREQLVNYVYSYLDHRIHADGSRFVLGFETQDVANLPYINSIWQQTLTDIAENGVKQEMVQAAKAYLQKSLIVDNAGIEDKADRAAHFYLEFGTPNFIEAFTEQIQLVTPEDIQYVVATYLLDYPYMNYAALPQEENNEEQIQTTAVISPIQKIEMDGITLLHREDKGYPTVQCRLAFPGGEILETEETACLSALALEMFSKGSKHYSKEEFATLLQTTAADFSVDAQAWYSTISMDCVNDDFETLLAAVSDGLLSPKWDADEFPLLQQEYASYYLRKMKQPESVAHSFVQQKIYEGHRFGLTDFEKMEKIRTAKMDDVLAMFQKIVNQKGLVISIFGDISQDAAQRLVRKYLGKLPEKALDPVDEIPYSLNEGEHLNAYEFSEVSVDFVYPGVKFGEDDMYPLMALSMLLSGNNSLIHNALRGEKSLVYAAYAYNISGKYIARFQIHAQTSADKKAETVETIHQLVHDLQTTPVTTDELHQAIEEKRLMEDMQYAQQGYFVDIVNHYETLYGDYSIYKKRWDELAKITPADIQRVAQQYLKQPAICVSQPQE